MSVASKRRFVTQKLDESLVLPAKDERIAHINATRGNNLHEVEDELGENYLVSMPSKFRKSVWIKRGQFVLVQRIAEGDKVLGEITHILDRENVLYIREHNLWPTRFATHAERFTRAARHETDECDGSAREKHAMIDADMLPASASEEEDEEEEEEQGTGDEEENDEHSEDEEDPLHGAMQCNPNHVAAPFGRRKGDVVE